MPKAWLRERKKDFFYRKSKEDHFRSRAAYKLLEATRRYELIKLNDLVVDLGAAPGGWMQAALKIVGEKGFVLGVDVKDIEPLEAENARSVVADINDPNIIDVIGDFFHDAVDVVISDVSPNISGVWELDHARQIDLANQSLIIADNLLKPGGNFFVKVFQGDLLNDFVSEVRTRFGFVRLIKPQASRRKSSELFVLGTNKR